MALVKMIDGVPVRAFGVTYANKAIDLGRFAPGGARRAIVRKDGRPGVDRLPAVPSVKMLHPQGHIVWVPVDNGMGRPDPEGIYGIKALQAKKNAGFLPFAVCPKRLGLHRHLAEHLAADTAPCKGESEETPCRCITEMQAIRKVENERKMRDLESARTTQVEREIASRDAHTKQLEHAVMKIADAVAGGPVNAATTAEADPTARPLPPSGNDAPRGKKGR